MFSRFICWFLLFVLSSVIREEARAQEFDTLYHPSLRQDVFIKEEYHYLNVPRVGTYTVFDFFDCTFECLSNPSCLSLNLAASKGADGKLWCELLSSVKFDNSDEYKRNDTSHHFFIKNPCLSSPCQNGGTCAPNYKYHTFKCNCKDGFVGEYCEDAKSCKVLYDVRQSSLSQVVTLILDSKPVSVLCQMGDFGCGDGGWTPVMKIDGTKPTFDYYSSRWKNKETFNVRGGETGFDTQETKLPTYWNTSFSKICLGMKVSQQINFVVINKQADSLHSLIADGQYRATSLGRNTWKSLLGSQGSLQTGCNKEGFNVACGGPKARIGIVSNNYNDCTSCDSRIGFGTGGYPDDSNTCGNAAQTFPDNGNKFIKSMGYILVQ